MAGHVMRGSSFSSSNELRGLGPIGDPHKALESLRKYRFSNLFGNMLNNSKLKE